MYRIKVSSKMLITAYVCLLLLLGSFLLLNGRFLMNHNTPSELPLDFLLRFGIFWFVSFVLALLFFVFHIRMHQYAFSEAEIAQSTKVGTFTFVAGVSMATLTGVLFYTLA
ncbi:hypothetical protein ABID22_002998 [Pontibacter aydingkolensis]|uniref:Uncharacterized protein n=1 Tax=Pontibacter aydingkolensis TaxID=1911536 RepID=A0ABS7CUM0_9BACT|nr:hypothetical protein [Pontibacter aydingkolensis]MBW7467490.1 hypothetical protein [Pontibacter aydingkolensis]